MLVDTIRGKLESGLSCWHLAVTNESHMHSGPRDAQTHFRVVIVSDAFDEVRRLQRHRLINRLLADEIAGPIHALAIEAVTPSEWEVNGGPALVAPTCMGGAKPARP